MMVDRPSQLRLDTKTLAETDALAACVASMLIPGSMITLDGDLGAGKTAFTQYLAKHLGVKEVVVSPTFTIIREYEDGILPIYHMDLYRLKERDMQALGLDDYWYGNGVSVVEWSSRAAEYLPPERLQIDVSVDDEGLRHWTLQASGEPYETWLRAIKKEMQG